MKKKFLSCFFLATFLWSQTVLASPEIMIDDSLESSSLLATATAPEGSSSQTGPDSIQTNLAYHTETTSCRFFSKHPKLTGIGLGIFALLGVGTIAAAAAFLPNSIYGLEDVMTKSGGNWPVGTSLSSPETTAPFSSETLNEIVDFLNSENGTTPSFLNIDSGTDFALLVASSSETPTTSSPVPTTTSSLVPTTSLSSETTTTSSSVTTTSKSSTTSSLVPTTTSSSVTTTSEISTTSSSVPTTTSSFKNVYNAGQGTRGSFVDPVNQHQPQPLPVGYPSGPFMSALVSANYNPCARPCAPYGAYNPCARPCAPYGAYNPCGQPCAPYYNGR